MRHLRYRKSFTNLPWVVVGLLLLLFSSMSIAAVRPTILLVDKKTNSVHVTRYGETGFELIKTFHATFGKVKGDKETEGDLKTPEGVYRPKSLLKPPSLKAKFGAMALYLDFPNPYDLMAGRTGSNIMIHATDDPSRLNKNYDSEGCIVLNNEQIKDLASYVRLGLTPVLIFQELTPEYFSNFPKEKIAKLKEFTDSWVKTWATKDIEQYISHYHSEFNANGKDKAGWKAYKLSLNSRYASINVKVSDIFFYRHPKYTMVTFRQEYHSTLKGGRVGHHAVGTKILYVAEEKGEPKIIAESITSQKW